MSNALNLTQGPIRPTLWKLAGPLMLTSFVAMAYSLTDMLWIGRIDGDAVAAVGIAGFLGWLCSSLSLIPRTGISVLAASAYGEGDWAKSKQSIAAGFQVGLLLMVLFLVLSFLGFEKLLDFYNLGPRVNQYGREYAQIYLPGLVFFMVNAIFSQAYQSLGNSKTPFYANLLGLLTNFFLNPLFIFGLGPWSGWGMRGAALATTLANGVVSLALVLSIYRSRNFLAQVSYGDLRARELWGQILRLGLPVAAVNGLHALISIILNKFMATYGAVALAVASVGSQMEALNWRTAEGFSVAITAMVAQNRGAGLAHRTRESMKEGISMVVVLGFLAMIILVIFRKPLYGFFLPTEPDAVELGSWYMLIFGLAMPFVSLEASSAGVFYGLGETRVSSIIGISMNLARIPLAFLLMPNFGIQGIWAAMSISSVLKGVITFFLLRHFLHSGRLDFSRQEF